MFRPSKHLAEGREAVIEARLRGGPAPVNPYKPGNRRGDFWKRGAERADAAIDQLMRIGQ